MSTFLSEQKLQESKDNKEEKTRFLCLRRAITLEVKWETMKKIRGVSKSGECHHGFHREDR